MKTFVITSYTNYGDTITIINAENERYAREIAEEDNRVWKGYDIEELDLQTKGVVFFGGGGD